MLGNFVVGIARGVKHLHFGTEDAEPFSKNRPAEPGHNYIGDEQRKRPIVACRNFNRISRVAGIEHRVTAAFQKKPRESPQRSCVIHEKKSFRSSAQWGRDVGLNCNGSGFEAGKIDVEFGPITWFAVNVDGAGTLLDDAEDGGEAKSGAFAGHFGAEKRLKDPGPC